MHVNRIDSSANPRFKRWKKIFDSSRAIKKEGVTLAEGAHLAQVVLERGVQARAMIIRDMEAFSEETLLLMKAFDEKRVPAYLMAAPLYDAISPVEHGAGMMLEVPVPEVARPAKADCDVLYLDGVQDPGNIGTLIRSAVAAGVKVIAAGKTTAHFWSPKALRAGMGAHFAATLMENVEPEELEELFAGQRLAADARGGKDLYATEGWDAGPTVWMMGAEGPGLSERALAVAHERLYIPIEDDCESLNVGTAATVCLFEQRRRRLVSR